MTANPPYAPARKVAYRKLLWVTPAAAVVAAILNSIVYFVGDALGAFPQSVLVPGGNMPITLGPIVSLSVFATIGAGVAFALLGRFTRQPVRNFLILAAVVFIAFMVPPFLLPGAPLVMNIALQITHVVVAGVAVYALTRYATE